MSESSTSVRINHSTWRRLHERKEPGESHDDVITDLLDQVENADDANAEN